MLKKIVSGGLPGVEKAALDAAIKLDIPHQGWTYKSRHAENDVLPERYNVKEIANPSYFERLEKNIKDSDGTVILTYGQLIRGSNATSDLAQKHKKPCLLLELNTCTRIQASSSIRKWMENHGIKEVFFTGSKPIAAPNINEDVILIIEGVCQVEREYEKFLGFKEDDDAPETIN
jgi:predicted Rossmann-fold nucleotide-binding protein